MWFTPCGIFRAKRARQACQKCVRHFFQKTNITVHVVQSSFQRWSEIVYSPVTTCNSYISIILCNVSLLLPSLHPASSNPRVIKKEELCSSLGKMQEYPWEMTHLVGLVFLGGRARSKSRKRKMSWGNVLQKHLLRNVR